MHRNFLAALCLGLIPALTACPDTNSGKGRGLEQPGKNRVRPRRMSSDLVSPGGKSTYMLGEAVPFEISPVDTAAVIDSVQFAHRGRLLKTVREHPFRFEWDTKGGRVGKSGLRISVFYRNGYRENKVAGVTLLSDIEPGNLPFRLTGTYRHDPGAYTQGLEYSDGYLYEGTGQLGESSLRKVNIEDGSIVQLVDLPPDIFGEGITLFGGKIYQLTYKSQVGFVYDKNTFRKISKVYYQNKEGWGLTHNDTCLIMSDGSSNIYFMHPEYFNEIGRVQVYDHRGPVEQLNELEYIGDKILANVLMSHEIMVIEPETGRVLGILNMQGILPGKGRNRKTGVMNGIAWNPRENRLYVTGKYWPKLFEIEILNGI